jgi:hypothetical protein
MWFITKWRGNEKCSTYGDEKHTRRSLSVYKFTADSLKWFSNNGYKYGIIYLLMLYPLLNGTKVSEFVVVETTGFL